MLNITYKQYRVKVSEVVWFRERNGGRKSGHYGSVSEMENILAERGWDNQKFALAENITEAEANKALGMLELHWNQLKDAAAKGKDEDVDRLTVFELVWTKKDKLIVPKYIGVTGNRRGSAFPGALLKVYRANRNDQANAVDLSEACKLMIGIPELPGGRYGDTPDGEAIRIAEQLRENEAMTAGRQTMSDADKILASRELVQVHGKNQAFLRENAGFSATTGVKLYYNAAIDAKYPDLGIIKHEITEPWDEEKKQGDKKHIPFTPIKHTQFQELGQRLELNENLATTNKKRAEQNKGALTPANKKTVQDFFFNKTSPEHFAAGGGTDPSKKMLDRPVVENLAKMAGDLFMRAAYFHVCYRDLTEVQKLEHLKAVSNVLATIEDRGEEATHDLVVLVQNVKADPGLVERIINHPDFQLAEIEQEIEEPVEEEEEEVEEEESSETATTEQQAS